MTCSLLLNLVAFHAAAAFNSFTPGAGALCPVGQTTSAMAGAFQNSEGRPGAYAAMAWQPLQLGPWKVGALAGAMTGYRSSPVSSLAGAVASTCWAALGGCLHITATPAFRSSPATLAVAVSFSGGAL